MNVPVGVPAYVLFGSEVDAPGDVKPVQIFLTHQEAEQVLAMALLQTYQHHMQDILPGGTCSILLTRRPADGEGFTTGSFAITNPGSPRSLWDFRIEQRTALPVVGNE